MWTFITYAFYPHFLKLGTQSVMYYKLRCNSTQFVIYYKLRNYYKLQRNTAPPLLEPQSNNGCMYKTIAHNLWSIKLDYIPHRLYENP